MDRNKPMIAVGEQNRFFFPPNLLSTFFKEEKTDEIVGFIEFLPDFYGSPMTHRNKIMRVVRQNVWNGWNSVEIPSTQEFQLSRSRDNGRKKNTSPANTTSQTRAKQTPKRQTNVPGKDGREKKSRDNTRGPGARQAGELKKMSCVASLHCIPAVCAAIERRDIRPCCRRGQQKHKQEPLLSSSRLLSLSLSLSLSLFFALARIFRRPKRRRLPNQRGHLQLIFHFTRGWVSVGIRKMRPSFCVTVAQRRRDIPHQIKATVFLYSIFVFDPFRVSFQ